MKTYFRQSGALGLPTVLVISTTEQNALDYSAVYNLEWCIPDDLAIEKTVDIEKEKTIMYTTQKAIRAAFWESFPGLERRRSGSQNAQPCDTRCAFVDYVDHLKKTGAISYELAKRVTL